MIFRNVKSRLLLRTLLAGFLLVVYLVPGYAQKKKKKQGELDKADIRASEFYFIEGEKYFMLEDYAKALEAYHKSLEIDKNNDVVYFKISEIMFRNEQNDEARTAIEKALELDEKNKYYYLLASDIYAAEGKYDRAAEMYELMIKRIDDTDDYLLDLAGLYVFQNKWDDALRIYDLAEQKFGIVDQISAQKQQIYLKINKVDEAIEEGRKLVDYYPGEPQYAIALADIMHSNGRADEAVSFLTSYTNSFGYEGTVALKLAELHRLNKNFDASESLTLEAFADQRVPLDAKIHTLKTYIVRFPDAFSTRMARKLGNVLLETHPETASVFMINADILYQQLTLNIVEESEKPSVQSMSAMYYTQCLSEESSNFNVWQNLLNLDLQLSRWDSLAYHASVALEYFPNQPVFYWFAGVGEQQTANYESSVAYLEQGVKMVNNNPQLKASFYSSLGGAYHALRDHKNSDEAYETALQINPNDDITLNNYAYYLSLRKENLDRALEMAENVVRRNPDNYTYLDTYAWVLYQMQNYESARKVIEKIISTNNASGVNYDHYGDILYHMGDVDGAVVNWQKAKSLNSGIKNIDKKINKRKVVE